MSKYLDKDIYAKARKEVFKEYEKPSAYRSMALIKKYKELGGRVDESKKRGGTDLWLEEKWKNLTPYVEGLVPSISKAPVCGKRHPDQKAPSICRPTIKKKGTTSLAQDFTKAQMKKALDIKKKGGVIKWNFL
tara:strand:+ start:408 stop:806 length:399 start_codon:yes stop_codon:yes gene_type:complete